MKQKIENIIKQWLQTVGCDTDCSHVDPYGFVPEADCKIHDGEMQRRLHMLVDDICNITLQQEVHSFNNGSESKTGYIQTTRAYQELFGENKYQEQLDEEGIMVGVSRQALEELKQAINTQ